MKNLMRVLSVLVLFAGISTIFAFIDPNNANEFQIKVFNIFASSFFQLLSIAICAYCIERNDTNYLVRIIPIYSVIPICLATINILLKSMIKTMHIPIIILMLIILIMFHQVELVVLL